MPPADRSTRSDLGEATVEAHIRSLVPGLSAAGRRIAAVILADPAAVAESTITELAGRAETSLTSVTRFCRTLGLPGYAELRLALAAEAGRSRSRPWTEALSGAIAPDDPIEQVVAGLVRTDLRALEDTAEQLDLAAVRRAVAALSAARRVDLYAVSGSAAIARDFRLKLARIGRTASAWSDVHDALTSATLLGRPDVAVAVTHSGATAEVVEALQVARARGATTVAVTNFARSPVADAADILLTTAARETTFRSGGPAARHAQLLVLDCLYVGVAQATYADTEQALDATGAALQGHRLPYRRRP